MCGEAVGAQSEMAVLPRLVCRALTLMVAEILDVDVGAESGVVGQVPAVVVGIFVDDDGIAVPIPVVGVVVVVGSYAEIEAAEPKALAISSAKVIDVAAAKAAGEAAVFPGMIEMIVRVAATGIMADPSAIVVDVRRIRMTLPIAEGASVVLRVGVRAAIIGTAILGAAILRAVRRGASCGSGTVVGNVAAAYIVGTTAVSTTAATTLRGSAGREERGRGKREEQGE